MPTVRFNLVDEFGRKTTRTWFNDEPLVAAVLSDVAIFAPLLDAVTQGGLTGIVITFSDAADAFVATSPSNIDENASLQVAAGDARNYDFDLPMPIAALRLGGGVIDVSNAALISFIGQFLLADAWRININNPTDIVSLTSGTLDK